MSTPEIIGIVVVAAAVVLLAVWLLGRQRRSHQLKDRFGSEYGRAVESTGSRRDAERELEAREERVKSLPLRALSTSERDRFTTDWTRVQAEFVDDPQASVVHADVLLGDIMKARGYPVADFEQRAADISVDHPVVVENYRAGHDIAMRHAGGNASTEDLRQAMVHYRRLFEDLTGETQDDVDSTPAQARAAPRRNGSGEPLSSNVRNPDRPYDVPPSASA
ncbi:MAG TPA: hypothetical protein VG248_10525 [Caulobacteraceae bacterium]|jgi:hypothetical protein|nr:hypothetical protein [Caulobacteraceae bacterium]